jgi:metal-sulfur cluster biosynthetic enzyme
MELDNAAPTVYSTQTASRAYTVSAQELDGADASPIDALEVFENIRHLNDPEHPLTLEQLNVVSLGLISVTDGGAQQSTVDVRFTPTIPHCSMATLIGLSIRVKLLRALPPRFKTRVSITPGTHAQEHSINRQLQDKERVAAALENGTLAGVLAQCFKGSDRL